jgi:MYXO-CTERM domain-containing protein
MNISKYKHVSMGLAALALLWPVRQAQACGCFAPPTPATPVVQAGERILFAHENDQVIAYIQIQYQGAASDFGWLVPLPSVPTLTLGSDELFTMLDNQTLPQYRLTSTVDFCGGGSQSTTSEGSAGGCGDDTFTTPDQSVAASDMAEFTRDAGSPGTAVEQASVGPYDYAVLHADDETAMLQWLAANNYFVPANTMDVVKPYIHPGGYFLALKLRSGESAGDITPIVLSYQSDLPMIPITLTQVGAVENMGVLVWVLGESRAIPRNYYDVVLDDMPVWFASVANYNLQLIDAVHEAPGKHGFITQYAGVSDFLRGRLAGSGRFGSATELRAQTTPSAYIDYLKANRFAFDGTLLAILLRYIPEPKALVQAGVTPGQFYAQFDYYANMMTIPGDDPDGGPLMFDPGPLTDEIEQRIVTPDTDADALIARHHYLTRMYTALSPIDMTIDPVFSFNPDLPTVALEHDATFTTPCAGQPWLATDGGFEAQSPYTTALLPAALKVQLLRDSGPPTVVQDNTATIKSALGTVTHGEAYTPPVQLASAQGCGCVVGGGRGRSNVALLLGLAGVALVLRRLRRRRG